MTTRNRTVSRAGTTRNRTASRAGPSEHLRPSEQPSEERITFIVNDSRDMVRCLTAYEVYSQQKPNNVMEVAVPYYVSTTERNKILNMVEHNSLVYGRNASPEEFTHKRPWWMKWSTWSVVLGALTAEGAVLTYVLELEQVSPTTLLSVSVVISLSSPILRCLNDIFQVVDYRSVLFMMNWSILSIVSGVFLALGGLITYILGFNGVIPTLMVARSAVAFLSSNTRQKLKAVFAFIARKMDWSFWSITLGVLIAFVVVLTYTMKVDRAIPVALFGVASVTFVSSNLHYTVGLLLAINFISS